MRLLMGLASPAVVEHGYYSGITVKKTLKLSELVHQGDHF